MWEEEEEEDGGGRRRTEEGGVHSKADSPAGPGPAVGPPPLVKPLQLEETSIFLFQLGRASDIPVLLQTFVRQKPPKMSEFC